MDKLLAVAAMVAERAAGWRSAGWWRRLGRPAAADDDARLGQGLAEYALILAGIAIVAVASLVFLGASLSGLYMTPINEEFSGVLSRLGL